MTRHRRIPGGRAGRAGGQSLVEYAGVVALVLGLVLALTTLRAHRPGRVPLDPVRSLDALVAPPAPVRPVVRPPARRPVSRVRRVRTRPRPPRVVLRVPRWVVG